MTPNSPRILVVRNDKLGDFMLAWPLFALLRHHWPEARLAALVPAYTAPMAELCPWIDEVVVDRREAGTLKDVLTLRNTFKQGRFDALLTLFSTGRVAVAGCLAGIPYRLAPATKLAQLCYNRRLTQRRSRSLKPEYAYNLDLGYRLLTDFGKLTGDQESRERAGDWLPAELPRPLLQFDREEIATLRREFCATHTIDAAHRLVFIHPGSGGSANNLSLAQYAELARTLQGTEPLAFVVTAGPGEEANARALCEMLSALPATVLHPSGGLGELARHLQFADLFISGSTGPLHIAAALDRPTAAFYPRHRSATPLRWQTLNAPGRRLAFVPPAGAAEDEVDAIDVIAAARQISEVLLR